MSDEVINETDDLIDELKNKLQELENTENKVENTESELLQKPIEELVKLIGLTDEDIAHLEDDELNQLCDDLSRCKNIRLRLKLRLHKYEIERELDKKCQEKLISELSESSKLGLGTEFEVMIYDGSRIKEIVDTIADKEEEEINQQVAKLMVESRLQRKRKFVKQLEIGLIDCHLKGLGNSELDKLEDDTKEKLLKLMKLKEIKKMNSQVIKLAYELSGNVTSGRYFEEEQTKYQQHEISESVTELDRLCTENLRLYYRDYYEAKDSSEESVKKHIIVPILELLGWDPKDTNEVVYNGNGREYKLDHGRTDFALRINDEIKTFIEAKALHVNIDHHDEQLLRYCFSHGVPISVLTNGRIWDIYSSLKEGDWKDRKVIRINLEKYPEDFNILNGLLSKENISNGKAIKLVNLILSAKDLSVSIRKSLETYNNRANDNNNERCE